MAVDGPRHAFEPVTRGVRLADKVAGALTDSIVAGRLERGDKLPPERELCEQFGVSRPVVREAVRSLIAKGLLAASPRRGHVVSALGRDTLTESLTLYLRGQGLDYTTLMEVRSLVEVENAGLAAVRASPAQLEALGAAAARLQPGLAADAAVRADVDFHRAIATAADNEFFELLLDSIRQTLMTVARPTLAPPQTVARMCRGHDRIVGRIAAADAAGAREAMRVHLGEAQEWMRAVVASDRSSPGEADRVAG